MPSALKNGMNSNLECLQSTILLVLHYSIFEPLSGLMYFNMTTITKGDIHTISFYKL